jgi:hypothetical protein
MQAACSGFTGNNLNFMEGIQKGADRTARPARIFPESQP